jgi:hypothetical protein
LGKFRILSNLKFKVTEVTEIWVGYGGLGQVSEFDLKRRNVSPITKQFRPQHYFTSYIFTFLDYLNFGPKFILLSLLKRKNFCQYN